MRRRVVLLGASNLTRGLAAITGALMRLWPDEPLDVLAALGHGRSYGARTWVLGRSLPGILQSRLWESLAETETQRANRDSSAMPPATALITDIGNDILYGVAPDRISGWVGEALSRLIESGARPTVTGLPLDSVRELDRHRFLVFRRLFFPFSRLTLNDALQRAEELDVLVREQAARHGADFVVQQPQWYGIDPIHFRLSQASDAWRTMLAPFANGADMPAPKLAPARWAWLKTRRPRDVSWLGAPVGRAQPCGRLPRGGTLSLF